MTSLGQRFFDHGDCLRGPGVALYWKDTDCLASRQEVEQLYRSGYIYRTVYDATIAEIDRINDAYDSR